jgi:hypothetical protein
MEQTEIDDNKFRKSLEKLDSLFVSPSEKEKIERLAFPKEEN